jgi:hypothetical protein
MMSSDECHLSWGGGGRLTKLEENKKNDHLVENQEMYLGGENMIF